MNSLSVIYKTDEETMVTVIDCGVSDVNRPLKEDYVQDIQDLVKKYNVEHV